MKTVRTVFRWMLAVVATVMLASVTVHLVTDLPRVSHHVNEPVVAQSEGCVHTLPSGALFWRCPDPKPEVTVRVTVEPTN